MKFFWMLLPLAVLIGCEGGNNGQTNADRSVNGSDPVTGRNSIQKPTEKYENNRFHFSLSLPESWQVREKDDSALGFAVNFFPPNSGVNGEASVNVHAPAGLSYISIWPQGFGTELPSGEVQRFAERAPGIELSFAADKQNSRVFLLKDGTPWAWFIVPANQPANWKNGFVFAQIATNNFKASCYDKTTGAPKSLSKCDPLGGDRFVREGTLNQTQARIIDSILASIRFSENTTGKADAMIKVQQPLPNAVIQSPLRVKGEAKGYWFFEADFTVELYDAKDQKLADGIATATDNWMTESFVPFTATLTFNPPSGERGRLVFRKANPSGLPENENSYSVPVMFRTK